MSISNLGLSLCMTLALVLGCTSNVYELKENPMSRNEEGLDDNYSGKPRTSWSTSGKLEAFRSNKRVSLQAQFAEDDVYTVSYSMVAPTPRNATVKAVALISWSIAGNSFTRKVSIGSGGSISAPASAVSVIATDDSGENQAFAALPYDVSLFVAKGVRADRSVPPTLTAGVQPVLANNFINVPVPQGVGVVSVNILVANDTSVPIPDQAIKVFFMDSTANEVLGSYDPRQIEWAPLPPSCDRVVLQNATGIAQDALVTFGIDG